MRARACRIGVGEGWLCVCVYLCVFVCVNREEEEKRWRS